jgi:hypothetical protein
MSGRRSLVLVWAVLLAAGFAVFSLVRQSPPTLMTSRVVGVSQALDVLDHGGPPLLASDVPYHRGIASSHLQAAGITDDQGIYLYLPLLGHGTGEHDPAVLLHWLFVACFSLLIAATTIVLYELFGSVAATVLAPLLLIVVGDRLEPHDLYWAPAWIALLGIPALLLAHRWWTGGRRRAAVAVLAPLLVTAGFATSIRSHSGLPIAISALGIVLLTRSPWRTRTGIALLLVAAYASVGLAFVGVRAYRDSRVTLPPAAAPTSHPFWHPAYLGLGYLPNKYGLAWNDSVAADAVERTRPGTPYLSRAYEHTLRRLYLHLVGHDLPFALRTYATKLAVLLADAAGYFWILGVIVAAAIATRRTRGVELASVLALPALAITLAPPLLSIPTPDYELGWLGAVGAGTLLGLAWAVTWGETILLRRRLPTWHRPPRGVLAATAAVMVVTAVALVARPNVPSANAMYVANASPFVTPSPGLPVATWRFAGRLSHSWKAIRGIELQRDDGETPRLGLYVRTTTEENSVQLSTRTRNLPAGRYALLGHVRVLAGGLGIVLTTGGGRPLASSRYWYEGGNFLTGVVGATFDLSRPSKVDVALENWTNVASASSWVLWDFELKRRA